MYTKSFYCRNSGLYHVGQIEILTTVGFKDCSLQNC